MQDEAAARIRGIVHLLRTADTAKARSELCDQLVKEVNALHTSSLESYRLPLIALLGSIERRPSGRWFVTNVNDYHWALDRLDRMVT